MQMYNAICTHMEINKKNYYPSPIKQLTLHIYLNLLSNFTWLNYWGLLL